MSDQKFNILFSGNTSADLNNLCRYIDEYGHALGLSQLEIDIGALTGVIGATYQQFPWFHGADKASPFKKVAAFTTNFVAAKPIITPFQDDKFGAVSTHQNAIVAYALSVDSLHGAVIKCQKRQMEIPLSNRIMVSHHYWHDLISSLSGCIPVHHFGCVALIYEALAYQANPTASYERVI